MISVFSAFFKSCVNTVLPPRCPVSGDIVDYDGMIAPQIWSGLDFITAPYCPKCGHPFDFKIQNDDIMCARCADHPPPYDLARSALRYGDVSRTVILRFKHADQIHLVKSMVPWMISAGKDALGGADYLVPVPLHYIRLIKRRYNQSAELVKELSKQTDVPMLLDAAIRTRATPPQGSPQAASRKRNVAKAFAVNEKRKAAIKGKHIVLIDDVYTTGSTVGECARALKEEGGAAKVSVLTVARVVKD